MTHQDDLRLARALFQFSIYLESCQIPFTLKDLYQIAYGELWEEMPGAQWLDDLANDEAVIAARNEAYTLKTIFDTMHSAELGLLLEVISEETAKLGIGMGVILPGRYQKRNPRKDPDPSSD